ncbi:MAG TPA: hypothetical protein VKC53_01225 [Patescibacteria group bacterium]|nr:hypothetical protein [Patescibacteria group bacterium]
MLLGTYQTKVVSGHRIAVPAPFRAQLGETYILARWYEGCLVLVGKEGWDALYKRLTGGQELIITPIRDTERFVLGSAYEVFPDDQGRIVIPQPLFDYSKVVEEVYFIGLGEKIEIWDKTAWDIKEKEVVKDAAKYIDELAKKK